MLKKLIFIIMITAFASSVMATTITGAGASFPYPVYSAWAYYYNQATNNIVNYQSTGSGAGIKQVELGIVDFGATDEPLTSAELEKSNLIQFPAVLGGVVPIINIDGVKDNELTLSGLVLAAIFQGNITRWDDPAIKSLNKGLALPSATINIVYRSDSSGTSAIFTKYLSEVSNEWKGAVGSGKSVNWPAGTGAKGNDGVAGAVQKVPNSIGYTEYAYAKETGIAMVSLINKSGHKVIPNDETFKNAAASASWDSKKDYYLWLINSDGNNSWPIAAATFILVNKDNEEAIENVIDFFDWAFQNGENVATELYYVHLPENLRESIQDYWKQ